MSERLCPGITFGKSLSDYVRGYDPGNNFRGIMPDQLCPGNNVRGIMSGDKFRGLIFGG